MYAVGLYAGALQGMEEPYRALPALGERARDGAGPGHRRAALLRQRLARPAEPARRHGCPGGARDRAHLRGQSGGHVGTNRRGLLRVGLHVRLPALARPVRRDARPPPRRRPRSSRRSGVRRRVATRSGRTASTSSISVWELAPGDRRAGEARRDRAGRRASWSTGRGLGERVDAHRRALAASQGSRRQRRRRDPERREPAHGAGRACRRRHGARRHRAPGRPRRVASGRIWRASPTGSRGSSCRGCSR